MRKFRSIVVVIATLGAVTGAYAFRPADAEAWQADYLELREILANSYANLGYASETGLPLRALDSIARARLSQVRTVHGGRGALTGFLSAFEDPHLKVEPGPPALVRYLSNSNGTSDVSGTASGACQAMGYGDGIGGGYSLPFEDVPGFRSASMETNTFSAGSVPGANGKRVGILRISLFSPHKASGHCAKAWSERQGKTPAACGRSCQDSIYYRTGALLAETLRESVVALEREGVSSILVDLGGNGGGSEWAGLALRAITNSPLVSPSVLVTNRSGKKQCSWEDAIARRCINLSPADPDSETVATLNQGSPAKPDLPLFVLVDSHTASASEYFAAVLRDSNAARIIGTRTMGAGCGYVDGGGEYILPRTQLRFRAPNCVRLRKDGSNERAGVRPDVELDSGLAGTDRTWKVLAAASETAG